MRTNVRLRQKRTKAKTVYDFQDTCPNCGSNDVIYVHRDGNTVCRGCGRVLEIHHIDEEREWMEYEKEKGKTSAGRAGGPEDYLLGSMGLSTSMERTRESKNLVKAQRRGMKSTEKTLKKGFQKIEQMSSRINLPKKFVTRAKEIFKALWEKKALRGRSQQCFYAACIYVACRIEKSQRTVNEICVMAEVSQKDFLKCYKHIQRSLGLDKKQQTKAAISGSSQIVFRFCSFLKLSAEVINVIQFCTSRIEELSKSGHLVEFQGKHPDTIASAAIFFVTKMTKEKKTVNDISEVTGKAPGTIQDCAKKMEKYKKHILPGTFIKKNS